MAMRRDTEPGEGRQRKETLPLDSPQKPAARPKLAQPLSSGTLRIEDDFTKRMKRFLQEATVSYTCLPNGFDLQSFLDSITEVSENPGFLRMKDGTGMGYRLYMLESMTSQEAQAQFFRAIPKENIEETQRTLLIRKNSRIFIFPEK